MIILHWIKQHFQVAVFSPHQTYPNKPFEGFESVLILAAFYGLEHEFKTMPEAPVFPEVCQAFFNNQRRVSFDMMTQQLSAIDTLKITKDQIEEVYQSSLLLNAECAYIKVLDQFLISELQSNKAIYVFFIQGYLRACSELEAQAFLKHYQAVTEYRRLIDQFSNLSHLVRITKLKAETCEQAEKINQALKVNWKGVFSVQSRLLHDRNHFEIRKKRQLPIYVLWMTIKAFGSHAKPVRYFAEPNLNLATVMICQIKPVI
jgi:hypothetical protein